jgi:hypothetical protein
MNKKRTDIHRPSAIKPDEYEYVGFEYIPIGRFSGDILGDCAFLQSERATIRHHMERTGGTYSKHQHGGNCHVCGAGAIYTVLFYHRPTNTYIRTGQDCAMKMEFAIGGNFDLFHTSVRDALELKAGKRKAEAVLNQEGLSQAWTIYNNGSTVEQNGYTRIMKEEATIIDIIGKLIYFGSLTPKQTDFLHKLLSRIDHRAEIEADRKAQHAAAANLPVPLGRTTIEGTVLTTRIEEGMYGTMTKMLVQHDTGWKVWGTVPSKLIVSKGDRIRFDASVEVSPNDNKFGFFSRPTKAAVLVQADSVMV